MTMYVRCQCFRAPDTRCPSHSLSWTYRSRATLNKAPIPPKAPRVPEVRRALPVMSQALKDGHGLRHAVVNIALNS